MHIDASNGVELSVRPNHTGGVTFVPVFSGERPSAVRAAIREAEEDLANPKFVTRLRDTADRATSFLGSHESQLARGRSGETRQLSHALGRLLGD